MQYSGTGSPSGPQPLVMANLPTLVVKILLIVNSAIFILIFPFPPLQATINGLFGFVPQAVLHGAVWQFFTCLFLHATPEHIILNMLFLWFFGPPLERLWGSGTFIFYYLLCGVGGGLGDLLTRLSGPAALLPGVGASGAIFGLMAAYALIFGRQRILAFFIFPMQARYFVLAMLVVELLWGVHGDPSGIGHFAHLGGALVGALYVLWRRGWGRHEKEAKFEAVAGQPKVMSAKPVTRRGQETPAAQARPQVKAPAKPGQGAPDRFSLLELDDDPEARGKG